ncbi:MAG: hypothetical protein KDC48_20885, partial [Planctomycetes bacterium]|nr:hypothetical protein [Planctomycetota bacterium]
MRTIAVEARRTAQRAVGDRHRAVPARVGGVEEAEGRRQGQRGAAARQGHLAFAVGQGVEQGPV